MNVRSKRNIANSKNAYSAKFSGLEKPSLGQVLKREFSAGSISALGVVSAFVSVGGFRENTNFRSNFLRLRA